MNTKRLILTIIAVFVLANLTGFLIHAYLLQADYMLIRNTIAPRARKK